MFGLLNTLNAVWLFKLVKMVARNERRAQGTMAGAAPSKLEAAAAEGKPADARQPCASPPAAGKPAADWRWVPCPA